MDQRNWMEKAIEVAQTSGRKTPGIPFMSMLYVKGDDLIATWNNSLHPECHLFFQNLPIGSGGTLFFPYEPTKISEMMLWILKSEINQIFISVLNTDTPLEFVQWAQENKIAVEYQFLKGLGERLNEIHLFNRQADIPFITLSFGMSLDGKIATRTGDSKYISGNESRQFVHHLRHTHQSILVGINTILIDHPKLTTRLNDFQGVDPIRIILDSTLKIDLEEPLLHQNSSALTYIVTHSSSDSIKKQKLLRNGVKIIEMSGPKSPLDLHQVLAHLKSIGIESILVEGGSTIHFSFIKARYFNRLYATISPIIIGGETAKSAVGGEGFETLKAATKLKFIEWKQWGDDVIVEAVHPSVQKEED
jgi:diaminohydroxyphosphoribosylaminopyrimidine deaminase/5-amino-6-(5-phosphoribosylamino)uracil reductase